MLWHIGVAQYNCNISCIELIYLNHSPIYLHLYIVLKCLNVLKGCFKHPKVIHLLNIILHLYARLSICPTLINLEDINQTVILYVVPL